MENTINPKYIILGPRSTSTIEIDKYGNIINKMCYVDATITPANPTAFLQQLVSNMKLEDQ
ncbi:Hypothetical protein HVR_LOCUS468 [uncultured virus]|nr:Hypothetical protein HVR_LOCUS468 [uncultured virus]